MPAIGKYDTALQMFVLPPADLDRKRVGFLRWLAENGRLEHYPAGPPSGHVAALVADVERRG